MPKAEVTPQIGIIEAAEAAGFKPIKEVERRKFQDNKTRAMNAAGTALTHEESNKAYSRQLAAEREAAKAAKQHTRRVRGAIGATIVGGLSLLSTHLSDGSPTSRQTADTPIQPAPAFEGEDQPETTQTTVFKVDQPGGGINSSVDELVELGQIEPENAAEYKQEALELHRNDPNVLLGEGLHIPVDHMQPTLPEQPHNK